MTPSGPGSAHDRELAGSREAAGCEVLVAAEAPRPALRSFNPRRGARDDDEAGKVRRARREAAWHAQCSRLWVFSEVAQTLLGRRVYSAEGNPAAARCSSRPGRIRAPRPARTRPAPPARPLRTLSQSLSVPFLRASPLIPFLSFSSSASPQRTLQPAPKFSHDPEKDIQETVRKSPRVRSAARPPSRAGKLRGASPE